jgi:hypothetical protein
MAKAKLMDAAKDLEKRSKDLFEKIKEAQSNLGAVLQSVRKYEGKVTEKEQAQRREREEREKQERLMEILSSEGDLAVHAGDKDRPLVFDDNERPMQSAPLPQISADAEAVREHKADNAEVSVQRAVQEQQEQKDKNETVTTVTEHAPAKAAGPQEPLAEEEKRQAPISDGRAQSQERREAGQNRAQIKDQQPARPLPNTQADEPDPQRQRQDLPDQRQKQDGFQPQRQEGYQQRPPREGYQQRPQQGGYQPRPQQGGYQQRPQEGGYQQRPQEGFQQRPQQGGYQHTSTDTISKTSLVFVSTLQLVAI